MVLSLVKKKKKKTHTNTQKQQNKQKQEQHTIACLHHRWRCYQAIALNDKQIGLTSLALLSPQLNDATW